MVLRLDCTTSAPYEKCSIGEAHPCAASLMSSGYILLFVEITNAGPNS